MSSYWEKRAAQRMFENMEEAEEAAEEVKKYYRSSSEYLKTHAKNIFEKYAMKHGLTQVEARTLLSSLGDEKSVEMIINRLEEIQKGKGELAKLDSPSYRHRIQRLIDMQQQVDAIMLRNYNLEKNYVDGFYSRFIEQAYYKSLYETMQRIGIAVAFNHISEQQIKDILNSKWYGKNYSERIWGNTQALAKKLKEELFVCFVTGQTEKEAADRIGELFGQEYMVARRLIRTESAWMTNQMDQKAYREAEIEKYRFTAVLDLRTSMICRDMDGKIFLVSEAVIGKNHPPMHPWCRSTTTPIIGDKYLKRMKRKFRNPETGEVETIPLDMTYKDWYKKYVQGTDAEKQDKVWKDGKIPDENKQKSTEYKMATEKRGGNDWSETKPRIVTKAEKNTLREYAKEKGITVYDISQFDGDPELLKLQIDQIAVLKKEYGEYVPEKITVNVKKLDEDDYAETHNSVITFNTLALRDRAITEQNMNLREKYFAEETIGDIAVHEFAHILERKFGKRGIEFAGKALYNISGKQLSKAEVINYIEENISQYAAIYNGDDEDIDNDTVNYKKYNEISSETFVKNINSPNAFTREFIRIFSKGMII